MMCCSPVAFGQTTGSVIGTVTDTSGAVVVGATLKLANDSTGTNLTVQSDTNGNYRFLQLPTGTYVLEVNSQGFKGFRRPGLIVESNSSLAVPVALTVGQVTETVEVSAGAALLEANTSQIGTVVDQQKFADLPLLSRNPMGLANLVPGVRGLGNVAGPITGSFGQNIDIGGAPTVTNGFLLDGVPNDSIGDRPGAVTFLTLDATQEFKILTSSMPAEFGRSGGGVVSVISKSGTNEFHGSVFEYIRNTVFKANDFFSNTVGAQVPPVHINQFGGVLGGPIVKNKLFFFSSYEQYKENRGATRLNTLPTAAQRAGDFSQTFAANGSLITIYDPLTTTSNGSGGFTRLPFQGNKIPLTRQSKLAQNTFALLPAANTAGAAITGVNNSVEISSAPNDRWVLANKVDYYMSQTRHLAVRYSWDRVNWASQNYYRNILDADGRTFTTGRPSGSLQYTDALSPSLLLEFKAGYNREAEDDVGLNLQDKYKYDAVALGFPASYVAGLQPIRGTTTSFPKFTISDMSPATLGVIAGFGNFGYRNNSVFSSSLAVTKIFGKHSVKTGYSRSIYMANLAQFAQPAFVFDRGFTQGPNPTTSSSTAGYGPASFLLGDTSATTASITAYSQLISNRQNYHSLFVQDDYKMTRKITLNLGLRWEFEQPLTDRFGGYTNIDLNAPSPIKVPGLNLTGAPFFPGTTGGTQDGWDPSFQHYAPRAGFAWQAMDKLVVRGGYGIFWVPTKAFPLAASSMSGFRTANQMVSSIDGGRTPFNTMDNPFPNGLLRPTGSSLGSLTDIGGILQGYTRNMRSGYTQEWNFTLQYQPRNNWLVETAYLGNKGTRLPTFQPINYNQIDPQYLTLGNQLVQSVPNPFFGTFTSGPLSNATTTRQQLLLPHPQYTTVTTLFDFLGDSVYHAFALKVEKRFSQGFSLLVSYTASKMIDNANGRAGGTGTALGTSSPILNWYNRRAERSISTENIPQRMVLTGLWRVPFAKNTHGLRRAVLDGWQLNAITTLQSGSPLLVVAGSNRPNVVPGCDVGNVPGGQSLAKWFNTACFTVPAAFTYGNSARTIPNMTGPGLQNIDFSILKAFSFKERYKFEFRGEAYNLFNGAQFDVPGVDANSQSFGRVSAILANSSRDMQFSLRMSF